MGIVVVLLRVAILGGVVFGLFFGLAYALRNAKQKQLAQEIGAELRALKEGLDQGLYSLAEVDQLTRAIEAKCTEAGIPFDAPAVHAGTRGATPSPENTSPTADPEKSR